VPVGFLAAGRHQSSCTQESVVCSLHDPTDLWRSCRGPRFHFLVCKTTGVYQQQETQRTLVARKSPNIRQFLSRRSYSLKSRSDRNRVALHARCLLRWPPFAHTPLPGSEESCLLWPLIFLICVVRLFLRSTHPPARNFVLIFGPPTRFAHPAGGLRARAVLLLINHPSIYKRLSKCLVQWSLHSWGHRSVGSYKLQTLHMGGRGY